MSTENMQQTLDHILDGLKSNDPVRSMDAMSELGTLNASSPAILKALEHIAMDGGTEELQKSAKQLLGNRVHQFVRRNINKLDRQHREFLLERIGEWEADGLIEPGRAGIIRQRYDFDTLTHPTQHKPVEDAVQHVPALEKESSLPLPPTPTAPRPSLMETLLSEASIKIYLYLGAFFVIASALILAAVVEAVRLPILAVATLAFGGAALAIHKRLPQPGFALFIIFSFLLPIDANVLEETLGLSEPSLSIYWTVVFLAMTIIWGLSIWFYSSSFFSMVAFVSLSLAFYRAGQIFDTEPELQIFLGMLASLAGLAGTSSLRKWKDNKFALPVFLLSQLQVLGLLLVSLVFAIIHSIDSDISNGWWVLISLTWLAAASFYALSNILNPTFFFPWMAVAALLPLPWFFLNTFHATQTGYAFGFWLWGAVFALASEAVFRLKSEKIGTYHFALLAGSALLFLAGFYLALTWDRPALTFAIFGLTALVYAAIHLLRPRWFVWSAALLGALFAYFTFFQLPILKRLEVPFIYQVLIASILLVVPELFSKTSLSLKAESRWPAIGLGILVFLPGIALALADFDHTGRGALVLIVYAILFTLHALHSNYEWLGYFAAAAESLAIIYALDHFNLDLWLPALTVLAVLYYAAGFFFRKRVNNMKAWSDVFIISGLTLGLLLSLASFVWTQEMAGWYIIVIALLFIVEMLTRPLVLLELVVETLLSLALYLILDDFNVRGLEHFAFGASLIWLGGDLILGRLNRERRTYRPIVLGVGYTWVLMTTFFLWDEPDAIVPTIYLSLYTVFFVLYAFLHNKPRLGYLATTFLSLTLIKICEMLNVEQWIFPLIALALIYYLSGYWLRRNQKANGWDYVLLYSGLGLAVLVSFASPLHTGLGSSIPVAITATLFAAEAFALRNVWWALPANALYLISYFMILAELNVDEPQFYSMGAALLGMLMHHLLTRAGSKTGAFIAGMLSQLVLLGTTYIQMLSTERLLFFFVLFIQSMVVLVYGLIQRSRSLVITPIVFAVLGVVTVVYSALKGLGPVILIGSTGIVLLTAGIVAVLMRERITRLGEQLSEWKP